MTNKITAALLAILSVSTLVFIYLSNPLVWALIPLYVLLIAFYGYSDWKANQTLFRETFHQKYDEQLARLESKVKELDTLIEVSKIRR